MKQKIKTLALLTGAAAITIHVINRLQFSLYNSKQTKELLTLNKCYEWRFGKIRYCKKGSGSPVLLIHDLTPGSSSYEFSKIVRNLSENHEVFIIDLIGYGISDKPNITYTNFLYVQLITDFIKNVIGKKTTIIATGNSAPTAIMAAHNDEETINKIVLISPQSLFELNQIPSKNTRLRKFILDTPILGTFVYTLLTSEEKIKNSFYKNYFYNSSLLDQEIIDHYIKSSHQPDYSSKFSYSSFIGKYTNANIIHSLKEINHSINIIAGQEETDINTIIDNYKYYNNSIESSLIPMTKHLPHLEQSEKFVEELNIIL